MSIILETENDLYKEMGKNPLRSMITRICLSYLDLHWIFYSLKISEQAMGTDNWLEKNWFGRNCRILGGWLILEISKIFEEENFGRKKFSIYGIDRLLRSEELETLPIPQKYLLEKIDGLTTNKTKENYEKIADYLLNNVKVFTEHPITLTDLDNIKNLRDQMLAHNDAEPDIRMRQVQPMEIELRINLLGNYVRCLIYGFGDEEDIKNYEDKYEIVQNTINELTQITDQVSTDQTQND